MIPVIDLFAGPGGLGEGFSSVYRQNQRQFDIKLSIEKDQSAHKTLELRSFYRQFEIGQLPEDYYRVLEEVTIKKREQAKEALFRAFPEQHRAAQKEAWLAELGGRNFAEKLFDEKIAYSIGGSENWVLIGGPPCQAYSIAGRSRVGGINEEDQRVYLYKEYLRIIAKHHPAIFVMENVKGLLSAKLNGEKIFHWILNDLSNPGNVFSGIDSPKYRIHSLVKRDVECDRDYLIKSEDYGIPQKRHRVILLGVRHDIDQIPSTLQPQREVNLNSVIGSLPKIRSVLNRKFAKSVFVNGRKKRIYEMVNDSSATWEQLINGFLEQIFVRNGLLGGEMAGRIVAPDDNVGREFVRCENSIDESHPLHDWYVDSKLNGVPNHQARRHLIEDLKRYLFASLYTKKHGCFPRLKDFAMHGEELLPDHKNARTEKFADRFRVQLPDEAGTTITSHISKDGHYFIHYDPSQCRSLTVRGSC